MAKWKLSDGLLMLLTINMLTGCPRTTPERRLSPRPETSPATAPARQIPAPVAPHLSEATPAAPALPAEPTMAVMTKSPALTAQTDLLALERLYFTAGTPPEQRREIIQSLGRDEDSARSLTLLQRIFDQEKRLELRQQVLETAAELESPSSEAAKWNLFTRAATARQPLLVRLSALQTLSLFQDARVAPLLEQYSRDVHPEIRTQAARMLREITE